MLWFKKKQLIEEQKALEELIAVEIPKYVKQQDKIIKKAKETAKDINTVIKENHFHFAVAVAAGYKEGK